MAMPLHHLFVSKGVSILFRGHDHFYEKFVAPGGLLYNTLPHPSFSPTGSVASETLHGFENEVSSILLFGGFLTVTVSPTRADVTFFQYDGTVKDSYYVLATPRRVLEQNAQQTTVSSSRQSSGQEVLQEPSFVQSPLAMGIFSSMIALTVVGVLRNKKSKDDSASQKSKTELASPKRGLLSSPKKAVENSPKSTKLKLDPELIAGEETTDDTMGRLSLMEKVYSPKHGWGLTPRHARAKSDEKK